MNNSLLTIDDKEISYLYQKKAIPSDKESIVCGANNFCVNTENNNTNYYCYGSQDGCLWDTQDCTTDSDCNKYTKSSPRYTDAGRTCQTLTDLPSDSWPNDACGQ